MLFNAGFRKLIVYIWSSFAKAAVLEHTLKSKLMSYFKNHETIVCFLKGFRKTYSVYSFPLSSYLTRYHLRYSANDFKSEYVRGSLFKYEQFKNKNQTKEFFQKPNLFPNSTSISLFFNIATMFV